ncbi:MAG: CPBP family intramembrane metalloprotease [Ruminococcaceae bacterium]|nr:CPBP family intramembrane metalloprotease [Oscillospiraceae bacterium]
MKRSVSGLIAVVLLLQWIIGWISNRFFPEASEYLLIAITQLGVIFCPTAYFLRQNHIELPSAKQKHNVWLLVPIFMLAIGVNLVCQYINLPILILLEKCGVDINAGMVGDMPEGFEFVLAIFFICVVPAFFEELLFRGVALSEYRKKLGNGAAILFTSLIFAWMHFDITSFVPQFFLGCIMAYTVIKTDALIWAVWLHMCNNLFSLLIQYRLDWFSVLLEYHPILVPFGAITLALIGIGVIRHVGKASKTQQIISQN